MSEAPDLLSTKHVTVPIAGTGPNKLDIIPSWFTTDWCLKSCCLLCPLYTSFCRLEGLHIALSVPSKKPQH